MSQKLSKTLENLNFPTLESSNVMSSDAALRHNTTSNDKSYDDIEYSLKNTRSTFRYDSRLAKRIKLLKEYVENGNSSEFSLNKYLTSLVEKDLEKRGL